MSKPDKIGDEAKQKARLAGIGLSTNYLIASRIGIVMLFKWRKDWQQCW